MMEQSKSKKNVGSKRPPLSSTDTPFASATTNAPVKRRKQGKMDVTPKLREKHRLASANQNPETAVTHSHGGRAHAAKAQTGHMSDEIHTKNGNTPMTRSAINKSLHFEIKDSHALPIIVVETYRDKKSKQLVKGPDGRQGDESCFSANRRDELSMILSSPTTNAYIYCFSMAHKRPHFVWSEQQMSSYVSRAALVASGLPKIMVHDRDDLKSPITVNNADGSLNFHMYSDATKEFRNHFDSIKTDFHWWMQTFDKLKEKKRKVDHRVFSEKIDIGYGRHGCSESASKSQN